MTTRNANFLLIDAGNSSLKWALYRQGRLEPGDPVIYQQPSQSLPPQSLLASQLSVSWQSLVGTGDSPGRIMVSNVAGPWIMDSLNQWVNDHQDEGFPVKDANRLTIDTVVAQEYAFGVKNAYENPALLGADRWAGLIAARHLIPGDSCIIDCGSALTIDVLTDSGAHRGGIIIPGREMMKKSLVMDADAIKSESIRGDLTGISLLGNNTRDAIGAGITAATAGAVIHVLQRYQKETGSKLHCVITGGGAQQLLPQLLMQNPEGEFQHEPDWVLRGLAIIADGVVANDIDNCEYMK